MYELAALADPQFRGSSLLFLRARACFDSKDVRDQPSLDPSTTLAVRSSMRLPAAMSPTRFIGAL